MLMIKEKYELSESGFSAYDKDGKLIFSYRYLGESVTFRGKNIPIVNCLIITADYEEEKRKLVILKESENIRSLLIYDDKADCVAEIMSPHGYTFVSLNRRTLSLS